MQKLEADGWVFVHAGGTVVERELKPGEELHVDTGCLAAMTPEVDFDVVSAGSIKLMLFAGEGMFFAGLTGAGKVWLQSLPFSRLCRPDAGGGRSDGQQCQRRGLGARAARRYPRWG